MSFKQTVFTFINANINDDIKFILALLHLNCCLSIFSN